MLKILLLFISGLACFPASIQWDFNQETNILGYRVYAGPSPRVYTEIQEVGLTNIVLLATAPNSVSYFAVTAYDSDFLESPFSNEVAYTNGVVGIPGGGTTNNPPTTNSIGEVTLKIRRNSLFQPEIYFEARANIQYEVQISFDIMVWYPYLILSKVVDGELIVPLFASNLGNNFFRVKYENP